MLVPSEDLILVNRGEFLDDGQWLVTSVSLMEAVDLDRPRQREEKDTGCDEEAQVGVPLTDRDFVQPVWLPESTVTARVSPRPTYVSSR